MKKVPVKSFIINGKQFQVQDYRGSIHDLRILSKNDSDSFELLPYVDFDFFLKQEYSLPVVKIDEQTYIFPTNAKRVDKRSSIDDYSGYCITDIDILVATQNYYYQEAKEYYESTQSRSYRPMAFRKRGRNAMSLVQFNLSKFIHGDKKLCWIKHRELQDEINYKQSEIRLQIEELESSFSKGEYTSYSNKNSNDSLFSQFGVKVKLQNGKQIQENQIKEVEIILKKIQDTFFDISSITKSYSLILSLSGVKKMHGRTAIGIFIPFFHAVGISNLKNKELILDHELAHFLDHYFGNQQKRYYLSDDKNSLTGQIAFLFRQNTTKKQTSEYQNRTTECFARAMEQYYAIQNNIEIDNLKGNYCEKDRFVKELAPLISYFITVLKK